MSNPEIPVDVPEEEEAEEVNAVAVAEPLATIEEGGGEEEAVQNLENVSPDLPEDNKPVEDEIPELEEEDDNELEGGEEDEALDEHLGEPNGSTRNSMEEGEDQEGLEESNEGEPSSSKTEEDEAGGEEEESEGEEEEQSDWIEYLKQPGALDEFMDNWDEMDEASVSSYKSSINALEIPDLTREEAAKMAEYFIELLEEDLAAYVERTGTKFPEPLTKAELKRKQRGLGDNDSSSSFDSALSDILPGEPSKIRMFYEKGVSVYADMSLLHLHAEEKVDKEVQVNLHRVKNKTPVKKFSRYAQTLEMTFIPMEQALLLFKYMYPQVDDFKIKEPPSRIASQERVIALAEEADPNIDNKRKGPQIISLSNKKQLLQPLMDDYYKEERFWTGSRFVGEYKNRQVFKGRYDHPTGVKIESEFFNGHFETKNHFGLVSYPRGDTFEGTWRRGRYQSGQITFSDGLKFAGSDWKYCEPPDRRFKIERYYGIKPAGTTLFSDQYPPPQVPPAMYDVGDGFYNPKTGDVRGYDGFLLRQATDQEKYWIEKNCRRVPEAIDHIAPNFLMERIPGSYVESQRRIPLTKKRYH